VNDQRLDLGLPVSLDVESFGEPGSRTFRLLAAMAEGSVSLWLEKQQIVMLGSALESLLERVPEGSGNDPESDVIGSFVGELDVRVGSLSVSYEVERSGFTFEASELTSDIPLTAIVLISDRKQIAAMAEQIQKIVSAGRPRCPLCGRPITEGRHFCPESNGHAAVTVSD
jgi:uncharacterized repeat protein (TIGR03847 family)